jgi:galactose-1-phosphate uridylyltransferase
VVLEYPAYDDAGSGWALRVVANKYPAVTYDSPEPPPPPGGQGVHPTLPAHGVHEVVVEGEAQG